MQPGTIISGVAHTALVLFALFGGIFGRDILPPPDVAQVTVLSEEDFAALTRPDVAPEPVPAAEAPTAALEIPDASPEPAAPPPPEPDPAPDPAPLPQPSQPDDTVDASPAPPAPPVQDDRPVAPVEVPRPRERVAADAAPPPPPDAEIAPEVVEAPEPDPVPEPEQIVEDETPTAPPEAAPEIVTEADEPSQLADAAPTATPRPQGRPARAAPVQQAPRTEGTTSSAASENVNDAVQDTIAGLEELLEQAPQEGIPAGPPLTPGEKESFRLAVRQCWNVDTGSQAASVTVSIRFQMTQDARVVSSSIRQVGASGGTDAAINSAFEAGRRAILRCQNENGGYNLPPEKYGQWQEVEVTFNPEGMRLR